MSETPNGDRARAIAAMHAFVQTFADDRTIPVPQMIIASSILDGRVGTDAERVRLLIDFAREHPGYKLSEGADIVRAVAPIGGEGVVITHTVATSVQAAPVQARWLS